MVEAWQWLTDTSMSVPGPQGHWPVWLAVLFHVSNLVMGITCLAIPAIVATSWDYRGEGVTTRNLWAILACMPAIAASRFVRVLEIFGPPYHLTTIVDCLAAIVGVYSAWRLLYLIRYVLDLRGRAALLEAYARLEKEVSVRQLLRVRTSEQRKALTNEVDAVRESILSAVWSRDRGEALRRVNGVTEMIKKALDEPEVTLG